MAHTPDRALALRTVAQPAPCRVEHLKDAKRRDHSLGAAGMMPEHDRGRCSAAPERWKTPHLGFVAFTARAPTRIVEQRGARRRLRHVPTSTSAGHHEPTAPAPVCRIMPPTGPQAESARGRVEKTSFFTEVNSRPDPLLSLAISYIEHPKCEHWG